MEDATSKKEVKNNTTVIDNTPWYCYLEEAIRVFLRCLGFENHESTKSGIKEKELVVVEDSSSSIISSEKDGEKGVNEPSHAVQDSSGSNAGGGGVSGATDPAASTTEDPDAADSPSTPDPALASPAIISLEDTATTAARRPSRPPINSGRGPQTN
ncbi:uncharacterized protein LOC131334151 isoform X2 [Rhododendron vialii]|uniref:uncharacterized protein LOC131334151 isoform X2 n=1 Tax=Rhododendron vialii TaxID=182163 RepID=UPI00265F9CDD|nr:uncharacterized protein LOC131334151 isoform X2 [Rhododendron vialii]